MIKFSELQYKHRRQSVELNEEMAAGTKGEPDLYLFIASMIQEWDFKHAVTGKKVKIPTKVNELDELSISQINEMTSLFNGMLDGATVKK